MKRTYTPNQDPPPSSNGGVVGLTRRGGASVGNGHINSVRSPYESSGSDHSENSSQGTFQEHGFEFHPPRLSDIPEYPEGGLDSVGPGSRPGGGMGPGLPRIPMLEPHINDDESEMSEVCAQSVGFFLSYSLSLIFYNWRAKQAYLSSIFCNISTVHTIILYCNK